MKVISSIIETLFPSFVYIPRCRNAAIALALAVSLLGHGTRAAAGDTKSLDVLLSSHSGAPTPEAVVSWFAAGSPGAPPLAGLAVQHPQTAFYLLPMRATGDFLDYLHQNPDSARAKLERYIIVRYPLVAHLPTAINALAADPYVEAVYESMVFDFGVPPGSEPDQDASLYSAAYGLQDGWGNLDAASDWAKSGGYLGRCGDQQEASCAPDVIFAYGF